MYHLQLFLTIASLVSCRSETSGEETLQCICTTATCQEIGEPICVTSGLCYTQFLDKKDGSDPVTKGCVSRKTPLLCENRRPKGLPLRTKWPFLFCCRTSMCNQAEIAFDKIIGADETGNHSDVADVNNRSDYRLAILNERSENDVVLKTNMKSLSNPAVLAIFCTGLIALLAIGITGCCVLQRQQMYYDN